MSEEEKKEEKIEETQEAGETASPLPDATTDEPPAATDGDAAAHRERRCSRTLFETSAKSLGSIE